MPIDRIYILGPEGTFSDAAARRFQEHVIRTGEAREIELCYTGTIPEALELASRHSTSRAVAPIENSESGTVAVTQDHLAKYGLFIEWEMNVRVHFRLVANAPLADIARLYVHPVAIEQCGAFIAKHLASAKTTFTRSNIDSGVRWASAPSHERSAAIVPNDYTANRQPLVEVPEIQNVEHNTTRFVVVRSGRDTKRDFSRAKTSLLVEPDADRPGLLFEILSVFKKHGINLCRIESRPARTRPWAYVFYMDITNNEQAEHAVNELFAGRWNVALLGTFDELPETGRLL